MDHDGPEPHLEDGGKTVPGFGIIGAASRLVPGKRRGEWRREWEAETAYAWQRMVREGRGSDLGVFRLRARVCHDWRPR